MLVSFIFENGYTEWVDLKSVKNGNGMDLSATVDTEGFKREYDAYLMIDGLDNSYVDLCKWYDKNGNEVSPNSPFAVECETFMHCDITDVNTVTGEGVEKVSLKKFIKSIL